MNTEMNLVQKMWQVTDTSSVVLTEKGIYSCTLKTYLYYESVFQSKMILIIMTVSRDQE